jgi:hypothetical protein
MASLLVVSAWTPPVLHEKERQVASRLAQVLGIKRAQERISGDPDVELVDQLDEERLTAHPIEECVHGVDGRRSRLSPIRGRSSMVEPQPSKLIMPVRSRSAALSRSPVQGHFKQRVINLETGKSRSQVTSLRLEGRSTRAGLFRQGIWG